MNGALHRVCIPIVGPDRSSLHLQFQKVSSQGSLCEWRVDAFDPAVLDHLEEFRKMYPYPMILTVRKESQGGLCLLSEEARSSFIANLAERLKPEFVDVEWDSSPVVFEKLRVLIPAPKIVVSYHDFFSFPSLEAVWEKITRYEGDVYKVAVRAHSPADVWEVIRFTQEKNAFKSLLCGLCLGEEGKNSRLLGPLAGVPWTYASLSEKWASASGQLTVEELRGTYRFQQLDFHTQLLALIGDPVEQSPSHFSHNALLEHFHLNAVYTKFKVTLDDLPSFFQQVRSFKNGLGFSITMPLKEEVLPFLDSVDPAAEKIGAVNTVVRKEEYLMGYNTDGRGALLAIKNALRREGGVSSLRGRPLLILGAGGTAKALAHAALEEGMDVTLFNRTLARAQRGAKRLGCAWDSFDQLASHLKKEGVILANTTPIGMVPDSSLCPLNPELLTSSTVVFDAVMVPKETRLLREAKQRGCVTVEGGQMFIYQALEQFRLWFPSKIVISEAYEFLSATLNRISMQK